MKELEDKLKSIDRLVRNDKQLSVKAFGILLIGKRFKSDYQGETVDPTELILERQGPTIPEL